MHAIEYDGQDQIIEKIRNSGDFMSRRLVANKDQDRSIFEKLLKITIASIRAASYSQIRIIPIRLTLTHTLTSRF